MDRTGRSIHASYATTHAVSQAHFGVFHLPPSGFSPKLPDNLGYLGNAGGA